MASVMDDPAHWQERANYLRKTAATQTDPALKQMLLDMAKQYDLMAEHAGARLPRVLPDKGK